MLAAGEFRDNLVSSALVSPHFTIRTAMPLLLASLADAYGFKEAALGELGAAYSVGSLVAAGLAVLLSGWRLRAPVLAGLAVGSAGLLAVVFGHGYAEVFLGFLFAGAGYGAMYSWMLSALAAAANPARTLAWQWSIGTLPGLSFLLVIPALGGGVVGMRWAFLAILSVNLLVGLSALSLPKRLAVARKEAANATSERGYARGVALASLSLFALYAGCTGGWSLLARVAAIQGVSRPVAGLALSLATGASCVVALMIARFGDRGGHPLALTAGVLLMVAGVGLIDLWQDAIGFTVGVVLFIALSAYALTCAGSLIARRAKGAGAAGLSAIALGSGAIAGPAAAGHLFQALGARAMLVATAAALAAGLWSYLAAVPRPNAVS